MMQVFVAAFYERHVASLGGEHSLYSGHFLYWVNFRTVNDQRVPKRADKGIGFIAPCLIPLCQA